MAGLKVIAGLGNPGREYAQTRHNAGWWVLDALAEHWRLGVFRHDKNAAVATGRVEPHYVRLIKPLTYMNRSGSALQQIARMNAVDLKRDLLVLVDDVALDPGVIRFRATGSPGGHNGLKSIEQTLGSKDYPRLRIGVGAKPPQMDLAAWVLGTPSKADRQAIMDRMPDMISGVQVWLDEGIEAAMNRFNG